MGNSSAVLISETVTLSGLIHPLSEPQFFAEYYGRKPLLAQADSAAIIELEDLMSRLDCLDLEFGPGFSLARDGEKLSPLFFESLSKKTGWLASLLQKRWTLICNTMHLDFYPVNAVAFQLANAVKAPVNVNAYYTPEGARGFDFHSDKHDVFIWQQHGRKNWKVLRQGEEDEANPLIDIVLEPGQVLYIPENCRHAAVACDGAGSLHLTFGFASRYSQAKKLLRTQVEDWMAAGMAEGLDDLVLPHNLPASQSSIQRSETLQVLEAFQKRVLGQEQESREPVWRRERLQRALSPEDTSESLARIGQVDRFQLSERAQITGPEDGSVCLKFELDTLRFRSEFEEALNRIGDGEPFAPAELPLEHSKAAGLCRVLIGAGVLRPAPLD